MFPVCSVTHVPGPYPSGSPGVGAGTYLKTCAGVLVYWCVGDSEASEMRGERRKSSVCLQKRGAVTADWQGGHLAT